MRLGVVTASTASLIFVVLIIALAAVAASYAGHIGDITLPEINPQAGAFLLLGFGLLASLVVMYRAHV
ncbi:hypothetical protein [Methanocella paludicola]|nr:hypothetical protein [Methanocella paludicola]